jgi:DNA-binding response OmpR family regulator
MTENTATILIVDDSPGARDTLTALLSIEPYRLVEAANGAEALRRARELQPDLILLDVMMPEIDGYEVCRRIRADPLLAEVPVIMVTALEDRASRLRGLNSGADDFISKPYDTAELRTRVRTITRLNRYRRLHAQRERFELVVAQAQDGYLITDADDTIRYANDQARLLLELPPDESATSPARFLETVLRRYRREPEVAWRDWTDPSKDDDPIIRMLVRPESSCAPSCWLQVEAQEKTFGEVRERLIRLRNVTESVAAQRGNWTFPTMISHKLRTPLNGVLNCLELLNYDREQFPPDQRELVDMALMSARRLHRDVHNVLRLSDRREQQSCSRFQLDDLPDLAGRISANLLTAPAAVTGSERFTGITLTLTADFMETILTELFDNARKFHPDKNPRVTVSVTPSGVDRIALTVEDDGISLSPVQLERVWMPLYQGEKYFTGEVPGMGVGLSVVASLVLEAGGRYRMFNRDDGPGVVVELTLPLVVAA